MKMVTQLKDYLVGTSQPPAATASAHAELEHRHWDRGTRTWIEHSSAAEVQTEAA